MYIVCVQRLDSVDKQVSRIVHRLRSKYGDTGTYKVRSYCSKGKASTEGGNKSQGLDSRKERDADIMREKQKKAETRYSE